MEVPLARRKIDRRDRIVAAALLVVRWIVQLNHALHNKLKQLNIYSIEGGDQNAFSTTFFFFFLFNRDGFRSPEVIIFRDDNQSRHRLDTDVTNFIVSSSSLVERKIFFFPMNIIRLSREVDKLPIVCHVSYKLEVRRIFYSSCIHRDR